MGSQPEGRLELKDRLMQWSVGIAAAPRSSDSYLKHTIESVASNFQDVHVFAEPLLENPGGVILHRHGEQFGDWSNWLCGLFSLIAIRPKTDYFLMLEDDVSLCKNLEYYLEGLIPQIGKFAALSIYTPRRYARNYGRYVHNECHGIQTWGSQALVFGRHEAVRFLSSPEVLLHRSYGDNYQGRDISNARKDAIIGLWADRENLPLYFHSPSLVQHTGLISSLGNESHESLYVGSDFDAMQLVEQPLVIVENSDPKLF
jgi:hypothetical protein